MSLRARVLVGMAAIVVVLAVAGVVVIRTTERNLVDQVDDQLMAQRQRIKDWEDRRDGPGELVPRPPSETGLAVGDGYRAPTEFSSGYLSADGSSVEWVFQAFDDGTGPMVDADAIEGHVGAGGPEAFTASSDGGGDYRVLAYVSPVGTEIVALPLADIDQAVNQLVAVGLVAALGTFTVMALVTWWVLRHGVRPIKQMTATATAIAGGDLSRRVPSVGHRTEAAELGGALNTMLSRIEEAFDQRTRSENRLRQFVADASHELRTPVTTIRGYAELFRAGALDDPQELGEAMRRTEQEAVRMGRLVEDLLHLARLDQGRPLEQVPVDLSAVVADAGRDARAVDPTREVTVVAPERVMVIGDESRLRQVVANVVGNALVHTGAGTPIDLTLTVAGDAARLDIADHGPGMSAEVVAHAFERFYRADPSRSRHQGGSGLGLSIVEATVGAHGGTVRLSSEPGAGTTVHIELPLHRSDAPAPAESTRPSPPLPAPTRR
ncbi:MAG: HAMP domain-containing sensor histidine kinase [Actinomycetota bacterium]|nr:HAMP domain-containing sensor histidine kinase [Actinomycetota bacterium]